MLTKPTTIKRFQTNVGKVMSNTLLVMIALCCLLPITNSAFARSAGDEKTRHTPSKLSKYLALTIASAISMNLTPRMKHKIANYSNLALLGFLMASLSGTLMIVTANEDQEVKTIIIDIDSPCNLLKDNLEPPPTIWSARWAKALQYNNFLQRLCDETFDQSIPAQLTNIEACTSKRYKRGVFADIAKVVGISVTNFVKSAFEPATIKGQVLERLGETLKTITTKFLKNDMERRELTMKDVSAISESSQNHRNALLTTVQSMPPSLFMAHHVIREILAGIANLKRIQEQCTRGRLAVPEISEMIGRHDLTKEFSDNATEIISVHVNKTSYQIEVTFETRKGLTVSKTVQQTKRCLREWDISRLTVIIIIVMSLLNIASVILTIMLERRNSNQTEVEVEASPETLRRGRRKYKSIAKTQDAESARLQDMTSTISSTTDL